MTTRLSTESDNPVPDDVREFMRSGEPTGAYVVIDEVHHHYPAQLRRLHRRLTRTRLGRRYQLCLWGFRRGDRTVDGTRFGRR
jgi:hypothetical protein